MAITRISRGFKDISLSFTPHPVTKDLPILKNVNAISRSVKNIVFTLPGEKFFNPTFGSRISRTLFENIDDITASVIVDEIKESIRNFEPRVELLDVESFPNFDNNQFDVNIVYEIIGSDIPPQELQFALQPTR